MHVLLFAPFGVMDYHFETDLEIAQRHLDQGDKVTIAVCNADLLACEANVHHDAGRCLRCVGRHIEGITRLSPRPDVVSFLRLSPADREELRNLSVAGLDIEALRKLRVDSFDVGWAVYSSLVSHLGGSDFSLSEHAELARLWMVSATAVYRSMLQLLVDLKVDRVYVFNGRFANTRAVLRAAQSHGIDCYIHERGSTFERYSLFANHLPHEIDYYQQQIREAWAAADPTFREAIGAGFYADRVTGAQNNWTSFALHQQTGLLPEGWRDGPRNVAVFTSSTDENDAVADVIAGNAYSDQFVAMDRIFASTPRDTDVHYFVRVHPRAQLLQDEGTRRLLAMRDPRITVIPPESRVSSYTLMRRASKVVSFGSTTGIEAAYWGTASILGLRAYYDQLGSTYNPASHEEMMGYILGETPPKDKVGALMYGYYQKTFGINFRYFHPQGITGGPFKASTVKPHVAVRAAGWLLDRPLGRDLRNRLHLKIAQRRLTGSSRPA